MRLRRPLSLVVQVEQALRQAIEEGVFADGRLPTEVDLAEQFGVSRETVRRATEKLQQEGLLVKYRRRGTFVASPPGPLELPQQRSTLLGCLQANYAGTYRDAPSANWSLNAAILQGAVEEAGASDYDLAVRSAPVGELSRAFDRLDAGRRLAGVLFASVGEEKLVKRVAGRNLPMVLVDHDMHVPEVSSVRDDSQQGAELAVRHLVALGHRRIAYAAWEQTELNPWRIRGYRQALREAKLPRRRAWEFEAPLTLEGAQNVVDGLLDLSPRPTAVFCFNNTLARFVLEALRMRSVRVPEDLSVVGGGGEEVAELECPQADWHEIGRIAVRLLLSQIAGGTEWTPEYRLVPHEMRGGRTTGPPCTDS